MINKYSQMESPAAASSCSSTTTSKSLSHSATSASSSSSLSSHHPHHHHHQHHHHSASASSQSKSAPAPPESSSSPSSLPCGSAGSTTASTTQPSAKPLKRKLFTAPPPGSGAEDEDKKAWTPKRRRSVQQEGSLSPSSTSANTSGSTPGSAGSKTPGRLTVPLSERQQMALILQMSAEESSHQAESATSPRPSSPQSVGKKTPLERKVNKQNGKGETPLHVAAINGDARQTKKLIKAGADVNIKDYAGWTPLHEACNRGHLDVAKQLLKAGANVNAQGLENDTPLHDASVNGHPKLVELLLRHGANPLQANDRGKVAVDLASNDHITKLLKNDMIASSSSSDSGTSDIRSPTSPESNAASDREEDKDVETLSVSLKKYRESAVDSSSSSKLISSMSSGGGSSGSPPKASDTFSSIMQAAGLHTDTTIPRTATPLVDAHRAGLHNTSIFNTARGGSFHSPSSHRQGAPSSTAGGHRGSSVSPGSRATSTSTSSRGSTTPGQTGSAVPPTVHSTGLATSSALSPSGRSHHHGHHHGHHGGSSVNSSSTPVSSSTSSHPTSSSHSSSSMSSSFHSGSSAVPGQSSFGFTPGSATHTGGPFGSVLGSGHMASHNLPPHGPHPQQPHSSSNIFKKVHMTHHMDKSSSPRLMLKFHHIRNKEKMGESPKRLKQNTGEAAPRTYSVTLGMGGRAEEYDEFDMKGDRAPSRAESTSSQDSEAFTEAQHRVTSYGSTKRSHPSSASPGPADTQQGNSPSTKVSSSNSNVSQSSDSRTNKCLDTGPSSSATSSAGSSGIKDTTTAADSQMPTLSHERDRFSPEFEDISDTEDMDTTSKSSSHNKSHIGTSNIPSSSSSGKSGQNKGDVSSSSTSVSSENKGTSRSQHIPSSSTSPYTFNSSSSGSSPTSSTVSSRGGKHDKGKHKESQQGKQDDVSGSREKSDNVDNSSKSDKSHKVSTSKDHDKSSKEIVSTSRASPKSEKDGYHSPKGHSPKGLSPKSDSSSKTELKSFSIKLEKDTKHEKPHTKVSSTERESSHSPKYVDKEVAKATSPKRYSPKLVKDKESSGNGKPSLKIDTSRGSPKPSSDRDSPKSANSDGRPPSPKVPPLKIIINPHKNPSNEGSHRSKESMRSRETTKTSTVTLPYVINPTQEGANAEGGGEGQAQGDESNSGQQGLPLASKASGNSSRSSSLDGVEGKGGQHEDKGDGSVVSSSGELASRSRKHRNVDEKSMDSSKSEDGGDRDEKDAAKEAEEAAAHERRLTRSQARSQKKDDLGKDEENSNGPSESSTTSSAAPVVVPTSSSSSSRNQFNSISAPPKVEHAPIKEPPVERDMSIVHMHPRKRKLRQRQLQREADAAAASSDMSSFNPFPSSKNMDKQANPYNMYLDIRKKVYRRHSEWNVVTPKAPQGFKDYLMVSCNYVLQGNAASKLAVPLLGAPNSLEGPMRDLFMDQEKARYKLRLQHVIEREKLMLSIEQETLRVHGRAARAMANQSTPLSVCSILRDEEIYNPIEVEDDKDKDKRQRYNGRQFLSWLQDVDDKFEKIKESLLLRHHHEAESLHAVQKLEWEWKLKELGLCDHRTTPLIDSLHVPMVQVSDEFDLLPA